MDRIIVNNLSFTDMHNVTLRKAKKYIAICMNEIEDIINGLDLTESQKEAVIKSIRKAILDNVNELWRSWLRDVFSGEVEGAGIY